MNDVNKYKDYLIKHFQGRANVLDLPIDKIRPSIQLNQQKSVTKLIISDLYNSAPEKKNTNLFIKYLAVLNILLYRYTHQQDITIGTKNGNYLPLRTQFNDADNFNSVFSRIQEILLEAPEKQIINGEEYLKDTNFELDILDEPDFKVMAVLGLENQADLHEYFNCELTFILDQSSESLSLKIIYNSELYKEETIQLMAEHFEQLSVALATNPTVAINQVNYLSTREKQQLLNDFNDTYAEFPSDTTLIELFEHQVNAHPESIAIVFENKELTYRELNNRANQLGSYLRQNYNITNDDLVGIKLSRSEWMVISILGILKAGGAYVPIDPNNPQARVDYIVSDSNCKLLIDENELLKFHKQKAELSAEDLEIITQPTDLAYVIYTSGSTGKPKGCMLEHRGVINRIEWMWNHYGFDASHVILQKTTFTFDVSVWELFMPLCWGTKMVICHEDDIASPERILALIDQHQITCLHFVPSMLNAFVNSLFDDDAIISKIKSLHYVMTSGEALAVQTTKKWYSKLNIPIHNLYGPTEASVDVTYYATQPDDLRIPIGKPISNTKMYVLDKEEHLLPVGIIGDIYIAGTGLARGYLNNPDLTNEKFIANPFEPGTRMYKTGDLGRWLADGNIEFTGRKDEQVKIRGYRIELGEVESALLSYPAINAAVVSVKVNSGGVKRLVAYIVTNEQEYSNVLIRKFLEERLPDYMIPSSFIILKELPKTSSGKTDKNALPKPERKRPELSVFYKSPKSNLEKGLAKIWTNNLDIDQIGIDDNFFELGGNSLIALKTIADLRNELNIKLPVTKLYQFPTINRIISHLNLAGETKVPQLKAKVIDSHAQPIAIIGMAGKFPGADTIDELWEVLKTGKETISFFNENELDNSISQDIRNDSDYVSARGIIKEAKLFDPEFFGINRKLAELMDPQQRIFLEISRDVLEKSGHLPDKYDGITGVFAGCGNNTYFLNNVFPNTALINAVGSFQVSTVNEKDYIASRTAYQLDLKGPAVSVFSACSTSLLAIAQAVESLRNNQCDLAIAGGASITAPINSGYLHQEGSMLSKDGHSRSFDAHATGTVFSDGAGVVLLKTLAAAQKDGDTIYGIIKGAGINNDGNLKGSFTAPSSSGQSAAITMALQDAVVEPATISYIEAHGTGTPIGDPIEIEGLKIAFGEQANNQYCAIGSIKSNMGHLTAAAGVAGLIKTTLALYYKQIPPSINFEQANTNIIFEDSPFYVNTVLKDWESDTVRRAGVSSFGVGGTNVHLVLEEFDHVALRNEDGGRKKNLYTWSAHNEKSLEGYTSSLKQHLNKASEINLADMASTLQKTRTDFANRRFAVASSLEELEIAFNQSSSAVNSSLLKTLPEETVFLFPGQGSQYLQMGATLYQHEPVFKNCIDTCAEILSAYLDKDIRSVIYPTADAPEAKNLEEINNTKYTQPALFAIEYALAKLWMSWGIEPSILCGHSIGEYVAAHLAGIFSLADGLKLITARAEMVSELPKGSMLSIRAGINEIEQILPATLSVAAVNSPALCVIAGNDEDINLFIELLNEQKVPNKKLLTSHAFHSYMMDPVIDNFAKIVKSIILNRPQRPIVSTVTGNFLSDAEALDPQYWAKHLRQTVQFSKAIETILELENVAFIECGPGNVCTTLVWQHSKDHEITAVASLDQKESRDEYNSLLQALGKIWLAGITPDWTAFYKNQIRRTIDLPTYAYDKKVCWVEAASRLEQPVNIIKQAPPLVIPLTVEAPVNRQDTLINKIKKILENASGIEMHDVNPDLSLIEIGLDSLLLTQVAINLKREFALPITFRQLSNELATISALAKHIEQSGYTVNEEQLPQIAVIEEQVSNPTLDSISKQLQLLSQQIEALKLTNSETTAISTIRSQESTPEEVLGITDSDSISVAKQRITKLNSSPIPGARLGKDKEGNPAWFVNDKNNKGKYLQVNN